MLVAAQLVVRYGFEPTAVQKPGVTALAGAGQTLIIEGSRDAIASLEVDLPTEVKAVSPLARISAQGNAGIEFMAEKAGTYDIVLRTSGQEVIKHLVVGAGTDARAMQDRRVKGAFSAMLWPAEDTLSDASGLTSVRFLYPESDLGWLPFHGPAGVLINFVLASMLFGFLALKPLGVQI